MGRELSCHTFKTKVSHGTVLTDVQFNTRRLFINNDRYNLELNDKCCNMNELFLWFIYQNLTTAKNYEIIHADTR